MGLVGARLYHVVTDWDAFRHDLSQVPADLERRPLDLRRGAGRHAGRLDRLPPRAHAVLGGGRLRGAGHRARPGPGPVRQLLQPGAVRQAQRPALGGQDRRHRVPPYAPGSTFHPTFLYESIWTCLFLPLIWFIRRFWNRVPATARCSRSTSRSTPRPDPDRAAEDRHRRHLLRPARERVGVEPAVPGRADQLHHPVPPAHGRAPPAPRRVSRRPWGRPATCRRRGPRLRSPPASAPSAARRSPR